MNKIDSSDLSTGAVFASRYRVERRIASGGMGTVYEVTHLETNRRRALKVMHEQFVQSEELRRRFHQEARVASEIESEHIVDVFDAGVDEASGAPFLVMELLRGEEIGKRMRRGPMPFSEALTYLHQAALALDKTHKKSIIHRDLKPDNLFLCEREDGPPVIKILDFGIAKIMQDGSAQAAATRALGTPLYMSPEQFVMDSRLSPAADVYALGMIAYALLVGKPYWFEEGSRGTSVFAFAAVAAGGPTEAATARAWRQGVRLPQSFDIWFARATARRPEDRFLGALIAVHELAAALGTQIPGIDGAAAFVPSPIVPSLEPAEPDLPQGGVGSTILMPETMAMQPGREASAIRPAAGAMAPPVAMGPAPGAMGPPPFGMGPPPGAMMPAPGAMGPMPGAMGPAPGAMGQAPFGMGQAPRTEATAIRQAPFGMPPGTGALGSMPPPLSPQSGGLKRGLVAVGLGILLGVVALGLLWVVLRGVGSSDKANDKTNDPSTTPVVRSSKG